MAEPKVAGPARIYMKALWLALIARKDTRGFYDAFSDDYDALVGAQPGAADASQFLREYLRDQGMPVSTILELGCGTGLYSRYLASAGSRLYGVDFSWGLLRRARAKNLAIVLVQGDILSLPYAAGAFDVVTSHEVLAHFPGREEQFFKEAHRVLKPGGLLLVDPVSIPRQAQPGLNNSIGAIVNAALLVLLRASRISAWTEPPAEAALVAALEAVGFRVEAWEPERSPGRRFFTGQKEHFELATPRAARRSAPLSPEPSSGTP